ncbi:hypothetical protein BaRGS_00023788 [Batillaria attramentaria]|uniref:Uncharacterized protein n=1 Tax=Batillaria attramentaria TaxID=370345 RepID=A0ABD0KD28_9CAEN
MIDVAPLSVTTPRQNARLRLKAHLQADLFVDGRNYGRFHPWCEVGQTMGTTSNSSPSSPVSRSDVETFLLAPGYISALLTGEQCSRGGNKTSRPCQALQAWERLIMGDVGRR